MVRVSAFSAQAVLREFFELGADVAFNPVLLGVADKLHELIGFLEGGEPLRKRGLFLFFLTIWFWFWLLGHCSSIARLRISTLRSGMFAALVLDFPLLHYLNRAAVFVKLPVNLEESGDHKIHIATLLLGQCFSNVVALLGWY